MLEDKIKVVIVNRQAKVKIPTGIRMLVRRCCNAVLKLENFNCNHPVATWKKDIINIDAI